MSWAAQQLEVQPGAHPDTPCRGLPSSPRPPGEVLAGHLHCAFLPLLDNARGQEATRVTAQRDPRSKYPLWVSPPACKEPGPPVLDGGRCFLLPRGLDSSLSALLRPGPAALCVPGCHVKPQETLVAQLWPTQRRGWCWSPAVSSPALPAGRGLDPFGFSKLVFTLLTRLRLKRLIPPALWLALGPPLPPGFLRSS